MPDLAHSLQGRDLGFLRIIALLWGVELTAPDAHAALPLLVQNLLNHSLVEEVAGAIPAEAQNAMQALVECDGRMPWPVFARRFGAVREMGPGRRDRERPYLTPSSPAEILWYRALIGRAFFDVGPEPQEFAFIPDDLLPLLPEFRRGTPPPPGRLATPAERARVLPANDRVVDHACTLLAGLRTGLDMAAWSFGPPAIPVAALSLLLDEAGLVDGQSLPKPDPGKKFLEAPRGEALAQLFNAWKGSARFNELRMLPGLRCEGEWSNDPLRARQAVLAALAQVPTDKWWSLPAFIAALRERQPDFQRPAGDYDSWYIRHEESGEYLRGFANWDAVDGALIRFLITGPLYWLGVFDLASPGEDGQPAAFRFSAWSAALLEGKAPEGLPREDAPLHVSSNGRVRLSRRSPRAARYQIARFCDWESETADEYRYRVTPASMERARQQGLRPGHLVTLLRRHAATPPSPTFVQALERWEQNGVQVRVEPVTLLRTSTPEILLALRKSRLARFLGEPLGPTAVLVRPGAGEKLVTGLAELGYLAECETEDSSGGIISVEGT